MLLDLFAQLAPWAIVEFVPKEDPMVRRLLATRRDVFPDYTLEGFRAAAGARWEVVAEEAIEDSPRVLLPAAPTLRVAPPGVRQDGLGSAQARQPVGDVGQAVRQAASSSRCRSRSGCFG